MLCVNCAKLVILYTEKICFKCKRAVHQNISVICDNCSLTTKSCAACLKKIYGAYDHPKRSGCRGCGRK